MVKFVLLEIPKLKFLSQQASRVKIQVVEGILPTHGELVCIRHAYEPLEVCQEFENFWKPIWMREDDDSQVDVDKWDSFLEEIADVQFPQLDVQIELYSPDVWYNTIKKLKKGTAHGVCGWRAEELQSLPKDAIAHLASIFRHIWPVGMPKELMKARTILLAKKAQPKSMNDSRPITILSLLCRLASKICADQILSKLSQQLPKGISGGLPQRGVKDLSLLQHAQIEFALYSNQDMGGFVLDLSKAFNKIPRAPLRRLFEQFAIPTIVADYWFGSLRHLKRFPEVLGSLGYDIPSTCGIPEGDSLSVVGMVILTSTYYYKMANPKLDPYGYADNWAWLTSDFKAQFKALVKVLNFVKSLAMDIDITKSWAWGASKNFRQQCLLLNLVFPDQSVTIEIKESAKDLGIEIHYNRKSTLGTVAERILDGIQRCDRLRWIPINITQKSRIIQTAIWPAALHSSDVVYIGDKHWRKLRRAATRALVGDHQNASSMLACTVLSSSLQDPLLYTVCQILRAIRRCAYFHPECAKDICQLAYDYKGKTVYGPSGALHKYLHKIGWKFLTPTELKGPGGEVIKLFVHSPKEIQNIVKDSWNTYVFQQIKHRKGISVQGIDLKTTARVFASFSPVEQSLLSLNMVGGYQTGAVKSIWASDCDGTCPFCGAEDGRAHRILECPQFQSIRVKHSQAVQTLTTSRQEWVYLPIARKFYDADFIKFVNNNRHELDPNKYELFESDNDEISALRFYTDGSCINPLHEQSKLAGWAVIQDTSADADERDDIITDIRVTTAKVPKLNCIATGVVTGKQSPARAELSAALFVTELTCLKHPQQSVKIFTDAQYVCNIVDAIEGLNLRMLHYKMANQDLITRLASVWNPNYHQVIKVKAHRSYDDAVDQEDLWHIIGNDLADKAAGAAIQAIPSAVSQALSDSTHFVKKEYNDLQGVLYFLIELNLNQVQFINSNKKNNLHHQHSLDGSNQGNFSKSSIEIIDMQSHKSSFQLALEHLIEWTPQNCEVFLNVTPPEIVFKATSLGSSTASLVWRWLQLLEWPSNDEQENHDPNDWGVTYFELVVNFLVCTGEALPIAINPGERYVQYCRYWSEDAFLLPSKTRAAHIQVYTMEKLFRQFKTLSGIAVVPSFPKTQRWPCKSLQRLGFHAPASGIPRRPKMPLPVETMQFVQTYLDKCRKCGDMSIPLDRPNNIHILHSDLHDELSPKSRFNTAVKVRKLAKRNQIFE